MKNIRKYIDILKKYTQLLEGTELIGLNELEAVHKEHPWQPWSMGSDGDNYFMI